MAGYLPHGYLDSDNATRALGFVWYVKHFARGNGGIAFALVIGAGIGLAWVRALRGGDRARHAVLLAAALPCYFVLGWSRFCEMRFLLPAIPFLLLLGALACAAAVRWIAGRWTPGQGTWPAGSGPVLVGLLGAALLAPRAWALRAELSAAAQRVDVGRELRDQVAPLLERDAPHLELAYPNEARLFRERDWVRDHALVGSELHCPPARARFARFQAEAPRVEDLLGLISTSPDLATLRKRMGEGGYRRLVVVLPLRHAYALHQLPRETALATIRECRYWDELVDLLRALPRQGSFMGPDGWTLVSVLDLAAP